MLVRSEGFWSGGAAAFAPDDVAGLVLWLDGGLSPKTYSTGSIISQWNDLSGNGLHAVNAVGDSNRAEDGTRTLNGIPMLNFDGDDGYSCGGVGTLTTAFHAFLVGVIDTHVSTDTLIHCGATTDSDDGWLWRHTATAGQLTLLLSNGVNTRPALASGAGNTYTVGVASLFEVFSSGDTLYGHAIDGTETTADPSIGSSGPDNIEIFALTTAGSTATDGAIAALLIYDHVLTGGDLTDVRAYLNTRFAL